MQLYPLTFEPILKDRVWGGRNLEQLYGKTLPPDLPVGESWEISDRPGDISLVANGPLAGKDLHSLIERFGPELTGNARLYRGRFPLLIKILDARDKLSLQVHPPADQAAQLGGEPKTELWFVAKAEPQAELYVGLKRGCTPESFTQSIHSGTVQDCFHRVRVKTGDTMFLPSGRVHALGAGLVIFEIQQNSDTTYRVFDWNRVGLDGKARTLHLKESLQSIDFSDFEPALVQPRGDEHRAVLVEDKLFTVEHFRLGPGENVPLQPRTMHILGVVSGVLQIRPGEPSLELNAGRFCLVPASLKAVDVRAQSAVSFLRVHAGEAK